MSTMSNRIFTIIFLFSILSSRYLSAQGQTHFTFGKIASSDFKPTNNKIDSGANAVVLADVGNTSFEGDNQGFFTLIFKRSVRVKIINQNGIGIGSYRLFFRHNKEKFDRLYAIKATTYNLENGHIAETGLDEKSVYTEQYNRDFDMKKFSIPALKEGSIYDLEYVIKSPFNIRLKEWSFQGEYPCYWSEYTVTIPPPFHYMRSIKGDTTFYINTTRNVFDSYLLKYENGPYQNQTYRATGNSVEQRWVKKDVPALYEEPYITSMKNYYAGVSFQLNYFQWETGYGKNDRTDYLENWKSTAKTLLDDDNFGHVLNYQNGWMQEDLKNVVKNASSNEEKARLIFSYMRDNFRTLNKDGYSKNAIWTQNSLKDVFEKKQGNVAEINLLLTAMLRSENIHADPLILSTRDHGIASAAYPLIEEYNYVICVAYPDDHFTTLDASQSFNGYGQIPDACYNGYGHIMNLENPQAVLFDPDSLVEVNVTSIFISNNEKGQPEGTYKKICGKSESYQLRNEVNRINVKGLESKIKMDKESGLLIENFALDSLEKPGLPISVHYDFGLKKFTGESVFYFEPVLDSDNIINPFKPLERHFPVEFPHRIDNTYLLNMEIPAGYQIEEIPKSVRVGLNGQEGIFEYLVQLNGNNLQMRIRLKLDKTYFRPDEYAGLRDFYAFMEKKKSEQIVFKKIK